MSVSELTASTQDYLKVIWGLQEWSDDPVTATMIATKTGLRRSSVSGAIGKLSEQGLVEHAPYGAVMLTESGRRHALAMVRRHRLIETFLVSVLGYRWDQVHDEAESLEHAVSDFMVQRIDEVLGHPVRDPHGDPIPSAHGDLHLPSARPLTEVGAGTVVVERISDADPELLRYFADLGVVVGGELVVEAGQPYSETLTITVAGAAPVALGQEATDAVWVSLRD